MGPPDGKPRGLPSLAEARAERRRAMFGRRFAFRSLPPQFWLWVAVGTSLFVVVYWKIMQGALESEKSAVMATQRAMAQSLGPRILPFRDKIEGWAIELATGQGADMISEAAKLERLSTEPAVYLRLRLVNARDAESIRRAAARSLHDGFTSCFFRREGAPPPTSGPSCVTGADCEPGLLCNEYGHCQPPPEPFNMRLAYRSLRVLSSAWTDELHEAESSLAVAGYERDLERVTRQDVPIAASILTRAKHFVLVLDEDPPGGLPESDASAGVVETDEERVQRVPHFARVGVWDLTADTLLVRVRRRAEGRVLPVGERVVTDPESQMAQSRQATSCALALDVRHTLERVQAAPPAESDGGAPDGAGVDGRAPDAGAAP